jgi:hypothetical protein
MAEPRDLDDLLAQAEPVDAPAHTARRLVALAVALVAIGVAVAIGVSGGFSGVLTMIEWSSSLASVPDGA